MKCFGNWFRNKVSPGFDSVFVLLEGSPNRGCKLYIAIFPTRAGFCQARVTIWGRPSRLLSLVGSNTRNLGGFDGLKNRIGVIKTHIFDLV